MNLSAPRPRNDPRLPIALIACSAVAITIGCGSVTVPKTPFGKPKSSPYADATSGFEGDPRLAQRLYQATRTAASQNSLVLQVVGDADPARILPLPPAGQTVYVSQLLEQTGVMKRYGGVSATLYRYNTAVIGGTRMSGGRGSVLGMVVGVLLLGVIGNMIVMLSVPSHATGLVSGVVILVAVLAQRLGGADASG